MGRAALVTGLGAKWMGILTGWATVGTALVMPHTIVPVLVSRLTHHRAESLRSPKGTILVHVHRALVRILRNHIAKVRTGLDVVNVTTGAA